MADGVSAMAEVSGLHPDEIKRLWAQVRANTALLESCRRHDFSIPVDTGRALHTRWRCAGCSGEVGRQEKRWYEQGLAHAGRAS